MANFNSKLENILNKQVSLSDLILNEVSSIDSNIRSVERIFENSKPNTNDNSYTTNSKSFVLDTIHDVFKDNFKGFIQTEVKGWLQITDNMFKEGAINSLSGIGGMLSKAYPWVAIASLGYEIASKIGEKIVEKGDKAWDQSLASGVKLGKTAEYIKYNAGNDIKGQEVISGVEDSIRLSPIDITESFDIGNIFSNNLGKTDNTRKSTNELFEMVEKIAYKNQTDSYTGVAEAINNSLNGNTSSLTNMFGISEEILKENGFNTNNSIQENITALNKSLESLGMDDSLLNRFRNNPYYQTEIMKNNRDYGKVRFTSKEAGAISHVNKANIDYYRSENYNRDLHNQKHRSVSDFVKAEDYKLNILKREVFQRSQKEPKSQTIGYGKNSYLVKYEEYEHIELPNYTKDFIAKSNQVSNNQITQEVNLNGLTIEKTADAEKVINMVVTGLKQGVGNTMTQCE